MIKKTMSLNFFLLIILALSIHPQKSQAHPHLFIKNYTKFKFQNDLLQGITISWRFDRMFSSQLIKDYDTNKSKRFEKKEITDLRNTAFANLHRYGYFIHMHVNGKVEPVRRVTNFTAWIKDKYVYYQFTVPIRENARSVQLALFDPTYFTDIDHPKNSVQIHGLSENSYQVAIKKSYRNRFSYGGMTVTPMSVVFSRK